jgi:hypothetical protein
MVDFEFRIHPSTSTNPHFRRASTLKETESRRNTLFEILDTLQANGGQVVINSTLTAEEFAEKFGADLWWRIKKMAKVMSLF